jgi:hypothetical protein
LGAELLVEGLLQGDSRPFVDWDSMVSTRRPSTEAAKVQQERRGRPSTSTVQAPHSPPSQPCLVPVSWSCSRR